tara:strand:- start:110 stop:547 length:438 start_codon:yes stop_codon:yes gene_type:complete
MRRQIPITGNLFLELSTSRREDSYDDVDESGEDITRPCIVYNDVWTFIDDSGGPGFEQAILEIYEDTWVDDYYGSDSDGKFIASSKDLLPSERKHIRTFLNWDYETVLDKYPWLDRWQIEDLKSLLRRRFNFEKLQFTLNYPRGY